MGASLYRLSDVGMFDEIIAPLFSTRWGRRAGWGVMFGAALLILYTFSGMVANWQSDWVISRNHKSIANSAPVTDEVAKLIAQIPEQHLFGKQTLLVQNAILPITSLQLRLIGVIKTIPEKLSRVIISERGGNGKVFHLNESLSSGVTVHAIANDSVVLENGGRLEKLPLQRPPLTFLGMPKSFLQGKTQEG